MYETLAKKDNAIMRTMKISEIRHIIAETNKGTLTLKLPFDGKATDYRFVLDAVPYPEKENTILLDLFKGILFDTIKE